MLVRGIMYWKILVISYCRCWRFREKTLNVFCRYQEGELQSFLWSIGLLDIQLYVVQLQLSQTLIQAVHYSRCCRLCILVLQDHSQGVMYRWRPCQCLILQSFRHFFAWSLSTCWWWLPAVKIQQTNGAGKAIDFRQAESNLDVAHDLLIKKTRRSFEIPWLMSPYDESFSACLAELRPW